ncbi:MAG: hypothetical protein IJS32_05285 [Kiritimatiellae bacterium]|nr:hypothetical protein [Kiritimatiellia bacterium]
MIDGETRTFLEKLHYEDCWARYRGHDLFFNGCQCELDAMGRVVSSRLEVCDETEETTLFAIQKPTQAECLDALLASPVFDGRTFWEIENELVWTDGPEHTE